MAAGTNRLYHLVAELVGVGSRLLASTMGSSMPREGDVLVLLALSRTSPCHHVRKHFGARAG
eukprot:572753-Amphidinium_carterae.1